MPKDRTEFLKQTQEFFQPFSQTKLSLEDARECVENISGFFEVLKEWDEEATSSRSSEPEER